MSCCPQGRHLPQGGGLPNLITRDSDMGKSQDSKKDAKKKPQKTTKEKKLAKKDKKNKQYE
jgi:hypothetical protein